MTFTKWVGWDAETNTNLRPVGGPADGIDTALGATSINAFPVMKSMSLGLEISF
jgi:TonB-dependent starch-binding outer membrane protein SusC